MPQTNAIVHMKLQLPINRYIIIHFVYEVTALFGIVNKASQQIKPLSLLLFSACISDSTRAFIFVSFLLLLCIILPHAGQRNHPVVYICASCFIYQKATTFAVAALYSITFYFQNPLRTDRLQQHILPFQPNCL